MLVEDCVIQFLVESSISENADLHGVFSEDICVHHHESVMNASVGEHFVQFCDFVHGNNSFVLYILIIAKAWQFVQLSI